MARSASEALWRGRIAAQAKSRLSALAYCTQEGFSPKSFYAWRRRLKQDKVAKQTPLFVPVELPAESLSAGNLRIELPGGAVVVLPPDASQERLVTVLRAVLAAAGERSSC
jgi:hypothetical protein